MGRTRAMSGLTRLRPLVALVMGAAAAGGAEPQAPAAPLSGRLMVYCAAGVREPVQEIAGRFEARTGVPVDLTFANSGYLLGQIETTRQGDVYVPGDMGFAREAGERNLIIGEPVVFCHFVPVLLVRKGNPKGVMRVTDLARPGMKLALADPSAAIGKVQSALIAKHGLSDKDLAANTSVSPATVTDVAMAVKLGTVDVGIVWDAVGRMFLPDTDIIDIPLENNVVASVSGCVLASTKNPRAARAFLDFLVSEEGRGILRTKGYSVDNP